MIFKKKIIPLGTRFSAPVQTGPGVHPASFTIGTGSFPGIKSGRGVTLTSYPLLVPWPRKSRTISLFPLWTVRPVQSLSACTWVHFTFTFTPYIFDSGKANIYTNIKCHNPFSVLTCMTTFYQERKIKKNYSKNVTQYV